MTKFYLLISLVIASTLTMAQTLIEEDFGTGAMPPAGWTIDSHSINWSTNTSANASGEAPEAKMNWSPQFNGTTRLISSAVDLTGETSVYLSFKHMLDDYSGSGYSLGVATTSGASGGTWTDVWTVNPSANISAEELTLEISTPDVGQPDFQFCLYFSGNSYNLDAWFIDDIVLFLPYGLDAAMSTISTPTYIQGAVPVEGQIKNLGFDQVNTVEVAWHIDGGDMFYSTFTGLGLDFGDSYLFTCDQSFDFPVGAYVLNVEIVSVNGSPDDNPDNNLKMKDVNVVSHAVAYRPVFEEFTSSTCGPCASFNNQFNPWLSTNGDDLTLVKYQMDWPGSGDPYYTEEAGVRKDYYGVSYVPWLNMDGHLIASNVGVIDAAFQEALLRPGFLSIASTHTIDGTNITVTANVVPFAGFSDFRVYIIVFEYLTTGNVASNGETEFHHVMMKMLPDANGTAVDMTDRTPVSVTESFDMSGTFVEEMSDLGVAIIVQDHAGYDIFQSAYSTEDASYATEDRLEDLTIDGVSVPGFDPEVLEYHLELEPGSPLPSVEGIPMDDNALVIVESAAGVPGATHIDVFAEDHYTHKRYTVYWDGFVGMDEISASKLAIYPNPTGGTVDLSEDVVTGIWIYNSTGQLVTTVEKSAGTIDMGRFRDGIYLIRILAGDGTVKYGKVVVKK